MLRASSHSNDTSDASVQDFLLVEVLALDRAFGAAEYPFPSEKAP
jgi:hypothetical protein